MADPGSAQTSADEDGQTADPLAHYGVIGLDRGDLEMGDGEALFGESPEIVRALARLPLADGEAMPLATCDRAVVFLAGCPPEQLRGEAGRLLESIAGEPHLEERLKCLEGRAALRYLFAVAAALESQVLGEPQVLGQVKEAQRQALAHGVGGARLDRALSAAYRCAKRIRSEIPLAERPTSLSGAAVHTARRLFGKLDEARLLMVGLAEPAETLSHGLKDAGLRSLALSHGLEASGAAAARRLGARRIAWPPSPESLAEAEIVVCAWGQGGASDQGVSAGAPGLDAESLQRALTLRRRRPILLLDLSLPGDLAPEVEDLEDAFVYRLDDLERLGREGLRYRAAQAEPAWRVVDEELDRFASAERRHARGPEVAALRAHFEAERQRALADSGGDAETATRLLVSRLLDRPSRLLGESPAEERRSPSWMAQLLGAFGIGGRSKDEE